MHSQLTWRPDPAAHAAVVRGLAEVKADAAMAAAVGPSAEQLLAAAAAAAGPVAAKVPAVAVAAAEPVAEEVLAAAPAAAMGSLGCC